MSIARKLLLIALLLWPGQAEQAAPQIANDLDQLGRSAIEYRRLSEERRSGMEKLEYKIKTCGQCPDLAALQHQYDQLKSIDDELRSREAEALSRLGLGRMKDADGVYEELRKSFLYGSDRIDQSKTALEVPVAPPDFVNRMLSEHPNPDTKSLFMQRVVDFDAKRPGFLAKAVPRFANSNYYAAAVAATSLGDLELLECVYGEGSSFRLYYFWYEKVPVNAGDLIQLAPTGSIRYLGTRPLFHCPKDETAAEVERADLVANPRPSLQGATAVYSKVRPVCKDAFMDHGKVLALWSAEKNARFADIPGEIVNGRYETITCTYVKVGDPKLTSHIFWHKRAPPRARELYGINTQALSAHVGTTAIDQCPETYEAATAIHVAARKGLFGPLFCPNGLTGERQRC